MRVLFHQSFCIALGWFFLPALAAASSYLPLPEASARVHRPVSSYYDADVPPTSGSSLINQIGDLPEIDVDDVPDPAEETHPDSPAASYGRSVLKGGCKISGKGGGAWLDGGYPCGSHCGVRHLVGGHGCWYGGARAVWFQRDRADDFCISVFDNAEDVSVLSSRDAAMNWTAGGEVTLGRYLAGGCHALELSYWNINPSRQQASAIDSNVLNAPNLVSAFDFTNLAYDDGVDNGSIEDWFNGARIHRVTRDYDFHNLELNFVHHSCCGMFGGMCGHGRRYNVSTLAGIRYLNFDESFRFDANQADVVFDGSPDEVRYAVAVSNRLIGVQVGGRGDFYYSPCLAFHSTAKVGIYGNRINHRSFVGGSAGAAVVSDGPNDGRAFDIRSNKSEFAMIGEIDLGASYQLSCRWRAAAGYRVIAVSGVALPGDQIPFDFRDIDGVRNVGSDSSLILHGGYAGLEYNY